MRQLTKERIKAIATLCATLLASVNAGLALAGFNVLPFTSDQVNAAVSGVLGFVLTVYAWYKNQNLTSASVQGQHVIKSVKLAQATGNDVDHADTVLVPTAKNVNVDSDGSADTALFNVDLTQVKV